MSALRASRRLPTTCLSFSVYSSSSSLDTTTNTTMGRFSDQTKLLVFGLLRTASALASAEKVVRYAHAMAVSEFPEITLRLARRCDVPGIQRCNLATLPENYNQQFYCNHLRQWPELALVAECNDPEEQEKNSNNHNNYGGGMGAPFLLRPDQLAYGSPYPNNISNNQESNIVAYVIGKVEEHVSDLEVMEHDPDDWGTTMRYMPPPTYRTERTGHVTSLAVLESHRRKGLAQALMQQLHYHMAASYGVKSVGLHVRLSNLPAERLYRSFGYQATERIPHYYQDGEDAFLMTKTLPSVVAMGGESSVSLFENLRRPKPWESGPRDLRLPRLVGLPKQQQHQQRRPANEAVERNEGGESSASDVLLTGTM